MRITDFVQHSEGHYEGTVSGITFDNRFGSWTTPDPAMPGNRLEAIFEIAEALQTRLKRECGACVKDRSKMRAPAVTAAMLLED